MTASEKTHGRLWVGSGLITDSSYQLIRCQEIFTNRSEGGAAQRQCSNTDPRTFGIAISERQEHGRGGRAKSKTAN